MSFTAGVLTLSDKGSKGEREDLSGKVAVELIESNGFSVKFYEVLPDEEEEIRKKLIEFSDENQLDLIVTTGGTGLTPRDVTPEATRAVIKREVTGIAEAMRLEGLKKTPNSMLSRGIAGVRGKTLIINLPGNPGAVRDGLSAVLPVIRHAVEKIQGDASECAPKSS
ncbi:MAG TPA: MogA/MoaB family molybdenum cofactor biosynthesis protein [bacterium]